MTRSRHSSQRSSRGRNLAAILITASVVTYVYFNSDPVISGTEPDLHGTVLAPPPRFALPPAPPQTVRASEQSVDEVEEEITVEEEQIATQAAVNPDVLTGRWAMLFSCMLLQQGCEKFAQVDDYTATLYKQERIGGELLEGETVSIKLRHEPFSVYMRWITGDKGRQVIYVDGQNDDRMLVQLGGIKGRLLGTLTIDPNSSQAMAETRHSIKRAGLLALAQKTLEYRQRDLERGEGCQCEIHDNQTLNDRPCYVFVTTWDSAEFNETYRKSVLYIDKELSMPVCVQNYTWAVDANPDTLDEDTLIENYCYSDIKIEQELRDADFDRTNRSYRMR
jgi:Protein of unknown function (DUF1571)